MATTAPSPWSTKYRGATVEDIDPPPALSTHPTSPIAHALQTAYERDYTHLTVLSPTTKALIGYISVPHLQTLLQSKKVSDADPVEKAMVKFERKRRAYRLITMETRLEELERFFDSGEDFAVVTDGGRRFVLGVATRGDLKKFVDGRPA